MRTPILFACFLAVSALLATAAVAADPTVGMLSVERGRGVVTLELKGSVLGRLGNGSITVTDRTPNDPYLANITGKRIQIQRRLGPTKVFIRGQGLRFRMLGGGYRIVIRGTGITLSAVGRGTGALAGEARFFGDDTGVYSLDGVDCSVEPLSCLPLPDEEVQVKLGAEPTEGSGRTSGAAR